MPVRRIVIDSAHVRGATTPSSFQANLANALSQVSQVAIVDAIITMTPIAGTIRLKITRAGVQLETVVVIKAGYYDQSFAIFKDHVIDVMSNALFAAYGGEAVYDRDLDRFVLSDVTAMYTLLECAVDNQELADLLGWSPTFIVQGGSSGILRVPPFRPYAWPRAPPPVYIHVAQMRTEHQAATGIVVEQAGQTAMLTPESLSGVASALTHVVPTHGGATMTGAHHRVHDGQVFDMPISTIRRLDIRVCTADGVAYDTPRVFLVLDAHCGGRVY